jgi:hypothetical protein
MRAVLPTSNNKSPPDQNLGTLLDSKFQLPPNLDSANACLVWSDSERFLQNQSMNEFLYKWLYTNLHCIRAANTVETPQTPTAWFRGEWHTEQLASLGALFNDAVNSECYIKSVADKYRDLVECCWQRKTNRLTGRRIRSSNNDERERKLVQITGARRSGRGSRVRPCCTCLSR